MVAHTVHARAGLSPASIAFYRIAVAAAVLAAARGSAVLALLRTADARRRAVIACAGASLGASQTLYFVAVTDAGVSLATLVCIGVAPVAVTVPPRWRDAAGPRPTSPPSARG